MIFIIRKIWFFYTFIGSEKNFVIVICIVAFQRFLTFQHCKMIYFDWVWKATLQSVTSEKFFLQKLKAHHKREICKVDQACGVDWVSHPSQQRSCGGGGDIEAWFVYMCLLAPETCYPVWQWLHIFYMKLSDVGKKWAHYKLIRCPTLIIKLCSTLFARNAKNCDGSATQKIAINKTTAVAFIVQRKRNSMGFFISFSSKLWKILKTKRN